MSRIPRPSLSRLPDVHAGPRLRQAAGALLVLKGVAGVLLPRRTLGMETRLYLRGLYGNPGDLEPTDTAVGLFRDLSLAAVVLGVLLVRRGTRDRAIAEARETVAAARDGDDTSTQGELGAEDDTAPMRTGLRDEGETTGEGRDEE